MSNAIHGAQIFRAGTHNGYTITQADLESIVKAFNELDDSMRVPLKFGHNEKQPITDGQPALGWVKRVWTSGGNLMADLADIPTLVFEAIKKGLYKHVSVELLPKYSRDGATFPWVLDAVALLGADKPAVRGMLDLKTLTMASNLAGAKFSAVATFTLDSTPITGAIPKMTEAEMQAAVDAANKTARDATAALEAEKKARFTEKVNEHRTKITARLEACVTEGRIPARVRDRITGSRHFKSDDDVLTAYTMEAVEAEIKDNTPANFSEKKAGPHSRAKGDAVDMTGRENAEVMTFRAQEECVRCGGKIDNYDDMVAATQRVVRADPAFAKAYFSDPRAAFKPAEAA